MKDASLPWWWWWCWVYKLLVSICVCGWASRVLFQHRDRREEIIVSPACMLIACMKTHKHKSPQGNTKSNSSDLKVRLVECVYVAFVWVFVWIRSFVYLENKVTFYIYIFIYWCNEDPLRLRIYVHIFIHMNRDYIRRFNAIISR